MPFKLEQIHQHAQTLQIIPHPSSWRHETAKRPRPAAPGSKQIMLLSGRHVYQIKEHARAKEISGTSHGLGRRHRP